MNKKLSIILFGVVISFGFLNTQVEAALGTMSLSPVSPLIGANQSSTQLSWDGFTAGDAPAWRAWYFNPDGTSRGDTPGNLPSSPQRFDQIFNNYSNFTAGTNYTILMAGNSSPESGTGNQDCGTNKTLTECETGNSANYILLNFDVTIPETSSTPTSTILLDTAKDQGINLIIFSIIYPIFFGFLFGMFLKIIMTPFMIFIDSITGHKLKYKKYYDQYHGE